MLRTYFVASLPFRDVVRLHHFGETATHRAPSGLGELKPDGFDLELGGPDLDANDGLAVGPLGITLGLGVVATGERRPSVLGRSKGRFIRCGITVVVGECESGQ